jgi:hypothetical protein
MGYRVVKGEFHLFYQDAKGTRRGSEPDGDSIWFKPTQPKLLEDVGRVSARFNKGGLAQLRFEGIDALECGTSCRAAQFLRSSSTRRRPVPGTRTTSWTANGESRVSSCSSLMDARTSRS